MHETSISLNSRAKWLQLPGTGPVLDCWDSIMARFVVPSSATHHSMARVFSRRAYEASSRKRKLGYLRLAVGARAVEWKKSRHPPGGEAPLKIIASIGEIQAELQRRIEESTWANCSDCSAPLPYRILHDGVANWMADHSSGEKRGCESLLLEVIASVRRDYDLPAQSPSGATTRLLSGRKHPA